MTQKPAELQRMLVSTQTSPVWAERGGSSGWLRVRFAGAFGLPEKTGLQAEIYAYVAAFFFPVLPKRLLRERVLLRSVTESPRAPSACLRSSTERAAPLAAAPLLA